MAFTAQYNTFALLTLLNQSVAGGGPITITSVQVGSGFPAVSDNPENYTGLKNPVQTLGAITSPSNLSGISSINATVLYQTTVRFQVSSQDAPSTYQWNEYGIWAKVGSGTPVLICYVTTGAATGDTVTPSGAGIPLIKQNATIINYSLLATTTTSLTLTNTVDLHASTHLDNGVDPVPLSTTSRTGLLTKLSGLITDVLRGNGTFGPGPNILTMNTTLYVAAGNPDISPNFSTVQNALNYLSNWLFLPGITVSILESAGSYSSGTPIVISHPQASQITISGPVIAAVTITGLPNLVAATGGQNATFNVSSTAGFVVGAYAFVWVTKALTNNTQTILNGMLLVTAVGTGTVTVFVPGISGWHTSSFPGLTGSITPITAIHSITGNSDGFEIISPAGLGSLANLMVVSSASNNGTGVRATAGNSKLSYIGVSGFGLFVADDDDFTPQQTGFAARQGATLNLTNCSAINNPQTGAIAADAGIVLANNSVFNANGALGLYSFGGTFRASYCAANNGHQTAGFDVGGSGHGILKYCTSLGNFYGALAEDCSNLDMGNSVVINNSSLDLYVAVMSVFTIGNTNTYSTYATEGGGVFQ